ncbi:MAG: tRNA (adenosine(37)-N6)-threonylcarbamoyltransferase complex transferase subunit TsaD [Bacteroidota bacterium]
MSVTILGIESSCDDTSVAVVKDGVLLSNIVSSQEVHRKFGGVVPELASRAHQQSIIPVAALALKEAGTDVRDISAVAYTKGPGLLGSLLVGISFAKGFSLAGNIPMIGVNHLQAHVLAHFIRHEGEKFSPPAFPFLCLLISGGHTQIIIVHDHLKMEIIGQTIDDAAGEAFDKCGKVIGLPYPAGPEIDIISKNGDPFAFRFAKPGIKGHDFSFSGLKTSFLYFLRDNLKNNPTFIEDRKADLCASLQRTIVEILTEKLINAAKVTGIREIALAGGVSANSGLREAVTETGRKRKWKVYIPPVKYTTDNAAMIAVTAYYKYLAKQFSGHNDIPLARYKLPG